MCVRARTWICVFKVTLALPFLVAPLILQIQFLPKWQGYMCGVDWLSFIYYVFTL
jgi:hypothetical protein